MRSRSEEEFSGVLFKLCIIISSKRVYRLSVFEIFCVLRSKGKSLHKSDSKSDFKPFAIKKASLPDDLFKLVTNL